MANEQPDLNPFNEGEVDYREHHRPSGSKKVIQAPFVVPPLDVAATPIVSRPPVQKAITVASQDWDLERNTAYRIVSTVNTYFRLSSTASAAVIGDMWLEAGKPMIIHSGLYWKKLQAVRVSVDGAMQVLKLD